jgi:hypothetical protein
MRHSRDIRRTAVALALTVLTSVCVWPARRVSAHGPADRLLFLDIRGGRVVSASTDGQDVKVLVHGTHPAARTALP